MLCKDKEWRSVLLPLHKRFIVPWLQYSVKVYFGKIGRLARLFFCPEGQSEGNLPLCPSPNRTVFRDGKPSGKLEV